MRISDWSSDVCSSDLVEEGVVGTDAGSGVGRSSRIGSRVRRTESSQRHIAKDDANRFVEGDAGHSARPFRDLRSEADRAVLTPVPLDDKIFSMYARGMTVRETLSFGAARLRSEERRVGKECVNTGRTRGAA